MSHTIENKKQLIARTRRLKGQIEAIESALEAEAPCSEILNLAASVRGAVNGLVVELIEDHIRNHVVNPQTDLDAARAEGAGQLIEIIKRYLK